MNKRRTKFGRRDRGRGSAVKAIKGARGAGESRRVEHAGSRATSSGVEHGSSRAASGRHGGHARSSARADKRSRTTRSGGVGGVLSAGVVVEGTVSAHRAGYGFLRVE